MSKRGKYKVKELYPDGTKECSSCKHTLILKEFNKATGGYRSAKCKGCVKEQNRAIRYKRDYGITIADYEQIYRDQGGVCKICSKVPTVERLHVDHDHDTGAVRGLLCRQCNAALGMLGDSVEIIQNAINYLKETK